MAGTDRNPHYGFFPLWLAMGLAGCALLLYGCLMHNPPEVDINEFDKVEHFTAYLLLAAWFGALFASRHIRVFCGLAAFGAFIEIVQWLSGYRDGSVYDLTADCLGALCGLMLVRAGAMNWLGYIDRRVAATRNRPG